MSAPGETAQDPIPPAITPTMHPTQHHPNHFEISSIQKSGAGSVDVVWLPSNGDKASITRLDLLRLFNHRNGEWCHGLDTYSFWDKAGLETAKSHSGRIYGFRTGVSGDYVLFYATSLSLCTNEHFEQCSLGIRGDAFILKEAKPVVGGHKMNPSYEDVTQELLITNTSDGDSALSELVQSFNKAGESTSGRVTPIGSGYETIAH